MRATLQFVDQFNTKAQRHKVTKGFLNPALSLVLCNDLVNSVHAPSGTIEHEIAVIGKVFALRPSGPSLWDRPPPE
jgi:hypothetical protein